MADAFREISLPDTAYVYNAGEEAGFRLEALAAIYDSGTVRHLVDRGVGPDWQCLEVGAGSGTIAAWLAERVSPSGNVLATDIDLRFMHSLHHPCLEVVRHDVTFDPLPQAKFDLIHTRLVLMHLPLRDAALARLVAALRPAGWLVVEEFDHSRLAEGPTLDSTPIPLKSVAAMLDVMVARGVDRYYGRRVPALLREHGLIDIGSESRSFLWAGASMGARLTQASIDQLRGPILASGSVSEREFAADHARMNDRGVGFPSPTMWATWARRPDRGSAR
jgi:SAM-dependent methyltransferase